MSDPISQPSMIYSPVGQRAQHIAPVPRPTSTESHQYSPNTPSFPKPVSLGRQIHQAYDYRDLPSHEYKDPESMSDRTSATYSRTNSVTNAKYQQVYSPTYSHASRMEVGGQSHGWGQGTGSSRDHTPPGHPRTSAGPVIEYMPPDDEEDKGDHAVQILLWMALVDPLYSLIGAIYALLAVLILIILTPLRMCDSSCSLKRSTIQLLSPILNKHLRFLHFEANEFSDYKASCLVMLYLLAPFVSFGVAIAAWVSASFWIFALIMGNPDGTERGDDGRNTILAVRNWWAGYLTKALVR